MGFGTLFFGYLFLFNTVSFTGFTKIIAYLIMLLALLKLRPYNPPFKSAFISLIPLSLMGLVLFYLDAADLLSFSVSADAITYCAVITSVLEFVFSFYLLKGLQAISKETGVYVLEVRAFRNRLFTVLYYLLFILGQIPWKGGAVFWAYYSIVILLFGFAVMILNAKLIYNCYMWICLEGEEDMGRRRSSFKPLDKLYERLDALWESFAKRRGEADAEYRRLQAEKKNKKKGKKK